MYLTDDENERDSATTWRMIFEMIGVLLAVLIQGIMITYYGSKYSCESELSVNNQTIISNLTQNIQEYSKLGEGYLISAGVMCLILVCCISATFFGTKEMRGLIIFFDHVKLVILRFVYRCDRR
jgi:Na+/melibiose symporter-like transporter